MNLEDLASKEVVGALIGAAGAFWAALWVARDARKRESRSAAMVVISTLGNMTAMAHTLKTNMPSGLSERSAARHIADNLVKFFPRLDPMYGACIARLMPVHILLAVKLHQVSSVHETMVVLVDRLCADKQSSHQQGAPLRPQAEIQEDERIVALGLTTIQRDCAIAQELLDLLVLSSWAPLRRAGLWIGVVGSDALKAALKDSKAASSAR